jgi:hypothetical protein
MIPAEAPPQPTRPAIKRGKLSQFGSSVFCSFQTSFQFLYREKRTKSLQPC